MPRIRPRRASFAVAIALSAGAVLASCATAPTPTPTADAPAAVAPSPITDRMVRCMEDAGWGAVRSPFGGIESPGEMPAELGEQWIAASEQCGEETGWNTALQRLDEAQIRELYSQEVQTQRCIIERGLDAEDVPSEQTYVDTFNTSEQYYAIEAAGNVPDKEYEALVRACPPPTWFLNVEGLG